jgi:hypothetical protein
MVTKALALPQIQPAWGFVCGRIAALEERMVSREWLAALLTQPRMEEVFRQVAALPAAGGLSGDFASVDWHRQLDTYYEHHLLDLREYCPDPAVIDIWLVGHDYLNLKHALRREAVMPFPPALLSREVLSAVAAGDVGPLPPPYRALVQRAGAAAELNEPSYRMDILLDWAALEHQYQLVNRLESETLSAIVEEMLLSQAIQMLWRAVLLERPLRDYLAALPEMGNVSIRLRELLQANDPTAWSTLLDGDLGLLLAEAIDTEKAAPLAAFEHLSANYLMQWIKMGKGQVAGPERVFAYTYGLSAERYNLKLVLCGRLSNIDSAQLRRRMRDTYV